MIMPVPIIIPESQNKDDEERMVRSLDRNLIILSTSVLILGGFMAVMLLGLWTAVGAISAVLAFSVAAGWIMGRYDVEASTVILTLMALMVLGAAVTGMWLAFRG